MFNRRSPLSLLQKVGDFLWPRMGWWRMGRYYWQRLQRIPGTPSSIALGFAIGAGMAMSPYWGTHIITGALVAMSLRASVLAVAIGAQVSNPWTAAPLWFAVYYIGAWILGRDLGSSPPNFIQAFKALTESVLTLDVPLFIESVWPVVGPMTLGFVPLGILVGVGTYFIVKPVIERVRIRRAALLRGRAAALGGKT